MLIKAKNYNNFGTAYNLTNGDRLEVGRDISVISKDDYAVRASGEAGSILVKGMLKGEMAIYASNGTGHLSITIAETGILEATDYCIRIGFSDYDTAKIVNHGKIVGNDGMIITDVISPGFDIINTGTILAERWGIILGAGGNHHVTNSGRIVGGVIGIETSSGNDVVRNSGTIVGGVGLSDGNDTFDGRGGKVIGNILGGIGNDRFIPGQGQDFIFGEAGINTLDFRLLKGAVVSLDTPTSNAGSAKGDFYYDIANIQGSARYADRLIGDIGENRLFGNGGNDRLSGMGGEDVLTGGSGRDTLTGGGDSDRFIFNGPGLGADVITDFNGGDSMVEVGIDHITLDLRAFGLSGGGKTGFNPAWFRKGATNQAQDGDDHFIFRTGDETLWFDRDGKGGTGPVLLADLQDGAKLNAFNFFDLV